MLLRWSDLDIADKIQVSISFFLKVSLAGAIIGEIVAGRWWLLFLTTLILLSTFLPSMITRNFKILLPIEFELIITLFIYASMFLGEIKGYYTKFLWWDLVLHAGSGLILGFLGFLIVYVLYSRKKVIMSPVFVAIFSFCFAIALGAIWEMFEFVMDSVLGFNMQKTGLVDTMWDLILDSFGAIAASFTGYFYVKGGDSLIFDRLVRKFIKRNPHLYKQRMREGIE
jgi:uncharacterized membrane protein YjdF